VLFLIALPLLDMYSMLLTLAGRYVLVVLVLGLAGFACGAALGGYVSVRIMREPWRASCRWATGGLIGMLLMTVIIFHILAAAM